MAQWWHAPGTQLYFSKFSITRSSRLRSFGQDPGFSAHRFVQSTVQVTNCLESLITSDEWAGIMGRTVEPRITLFEARLISKDHFLRSFEVLGGWAHTKAFETSLRSPCHFLRYFEVSRCRLHWWPDSEANWESKLVCLFAAWFVCGQFLGLGVAVSSLNVFGFVCHTGSHASVLPRHFLIPLFETEILSWPSGACAWHAAVHFKHFHAQKLPALLVWSRCGVLITLPKAWFKWQIVFGFVLYQWLVGRITDEAPLRSKRPGFGDLLVVGRQKGFWDYLRSPCNFSMHFEARGSNTFRFILLS